MKLVAVAWRNMVNRVIQSLLTILVVGLAVLVPSLRYLFKVFKAG